MELVDRYLKAVKDYLPQEQQDDIVRELSDNILSQMEDREAELGRPLSTAEQEAIIKQHGDPLVVAGRYTTTQDKLAFGPQIIGPVYFPFYVRVLWLNLGITLLTRAIITFILNATGSAYTLGETVGAALVQLIVQFIAITVVFAVAERNAARFPDSWKPKSLLAAQQSGPSTMLGKRLEAFAELLVVTAFLLWFLSIAGAPNLTFGDSVSGIWLAPVWQQIYLPLVLLTLFSIAQTVVALLRPDLTRLRLLGRIATNAIWLLIMLYLTAAGEWVQGRDIRGDQTPHMQEVIAGINQWFFYGLLVTDAVSLLILLYYVRQYVRSERSVGR